MMQEYVNFSSLPPDQEAAFVVFERRMAESQQQGFRIAGILSAITLVIALFVYFGVEPDHRDLAKDMDMSRLTKKEAPAPTPAAAPAAEAPAAPAAEAPAAPAEQPAEAKGP